MADNVFRRGETWYIRYEEPRGLDGKRHQRMVSCKGMTKRQAEQKLRDVLTSIANGGYVEPDNMTLAQFLEKWLADYAKTSVGAKTYERYSEIVRQHIIPNLGALPLRKLRPLHIQEYYTKALKSGRLNGKGGLSARSVLHIHRLLHRAFVQAAKWQLLTTNPVDCVEPPKVRRPEMVTVTAEQISQLLQAAQGTVFYAPVALAATTGMRRGEILALRWEDVDFERSAIRISRSLGQTKAGIFFKEPKTPESRRTIAVSRYTLNILEKHKEDQRSEKSAMGTAYQDQGLVCAMPDGSPISPQYVSDNFRWVVKRAGLPHMTFHGLRHSQATILIASGVPVKVVSEMLGHSNTSITQDLYTHVLPTMQRQAADTLDRLLSAANEDLLTPG